MLPCDILPFLMTPYQASNLRVGTLRTSSMAAIGFGVVLVFLSLANPTLAATVDTFAKVNLVQGVDALLVDSIPGNDGRDNPDSGGRFHVSGPADYCVEVQFTALNPQSSWTDQISLEGTKFASHHDSQGQLFLNRLVEEELTTNSSRYVVTLTYE